jgi:hypothetical protein
LGVANSKESQFAHASQDLTRDKSRVFPSPSVRFDLGLNKTPNLRPQNFVFGAEIRQRTVIVCFVGHRTNVPSPESDDKTSYSEGTMSALGQKLKFRSCFTPKAGFDALRNSALFAASQ